MNGDGREGREGVVRVEVARAEANTHQQPAQPQGQQNQEDPHQRQDNVGQLVSRDSWGLGRASPSGSLSPSRPSGAGVGESEYARLLMAAALRADADAAAKGSRRTRIAGT